VLFKYFDIVLASKSNSPHQELKTLFL
jgi:hypothetical protein